MSAIGTSGLVVVVVVNVPSAGKSGGSTDGEPNWLTAIKSIKPPNLSSCFLIGWHSVRIEHMVSYTCCQPYFSMAMTKGTAGCLGVGFTMSNSRMMAKSPTLPKLLLRTKTLDGQAEVRIEGGCLGQPLIHRLLIQDSPGHLKLVQ